MCFAMQHIRCKCISPTFFKVIMQLSLIKNVRMHTFHNIQYIWVNFICQHLRIWSENVPMVVRNTIWFIHVFSIKIIFSI